MIRGDLASIYLTLPLDQPIWELLILDAPLQDNIVRVLRGGACDDSAPFLRSASRFRFRPADRDAYFGFRPARTYH